MTHRTNATLRIPGLDCPAELGLVQKALKDVQGIYKLEPDYLAHSLHVEFDPSRADLASILARLRRVGFSPLDLPAPPPGSRVQVASAPSYAAPSTLGAAAGEPWWHLAWGPWGLAGAVLVAAGACAAAGWSTAARGSAIAATLLAGWPVARAAWRAVRLRTWDMNALMTLAAAGALVTGEFFEAATAMWLFGLALALERLSLRRAQRAIGSLAALAPQTAHLLEEDRERDVPPDELRPGHRVLVKPGERIPSDGRVASGFSSVQQAAITGESLPVEKGPGDDVFAGSINGEGALVLEVTRPPSDSTLAHIAQLIEQARRTRSRSERFVDAFARRYTPAVILLAVAVAALPPLAARLGAEWAAALPAFEWLHRGLVLLVIACPCALVIATPLTIVCALHGAARRGLLVKGGEHLENAGRVTAVAFDKTGTLTAGRPAVAAVLPAPGEHAEHVLRVAAALESHSEHPLARAIVEHARRLGLAWDGVSGVQALPGLGVEGNWEGIDYLVGSPRLLAERGVATDSLDATLPDRQKHSMHAAFTPVLIGTKDRLLGKVLLADPLRPDAAQALARLRRQGITRLVMLSGDLPQVAQQVAAELGIEDVRAGLLPEQKVEVVEQLRTEAACLAMVGDGVNDAPAMAAATVGIALGPHASDTALETADVAVLVPRVARVPELIEIGRRLQRILRENIVLALGIKAAVLILTLAGPPQLARLWLAVAADVGASLLVIANGMRMLRTSTD